MTELDSKAVKIIWSTRKAFIIAIGLGLVAFVLVSAVVIPQFQQALELYEDLEREQPKLEKLEQKLAELENIEVSPEFAQIEVVEEALPSKKPLLELMVALNTVSQETGAIVQEFELSPGLVATDSTQSEARSSVNYDELTLDLTIEGTFAQIQDFLLKVEEVAPFTTIVSMEIGNQLNTNSAEFAQQVEVDPTFEAVLSTETYFFTQSITSRVDTPLPKISQRERDVLNFLASFRPSDLEDQNEIRGGGLQDLFQVGTLEEAAESLLQPTLTPVETPQQTTTEEIIN